MDVQLSDHMCIFLKEVWQARNASSFIDCPILLFLLHKKIFEVFRTYREGSGREEAVNDMMSTLCVHCTETFWSQHNLSNISCVSQGKSQFAQKYQ